MFSSKVYPFPYAKNKLKNIVVVVSLWNSSYTFRFPSPPSFQCLSRISFHAKNFYYFFKVARIFLVILFSFLRRTLYNTWKSHYRQLQVPIMIFDKKALENISSILNSKKPRWNLLSFLPRIVVNKFLKISVRNCFSFALISNCWQNYKNTLFFTITHTCLSSQVSMCPPGVYSRPCQTTNM